MVENPYKYWMLWTSPASVTVSRLRVWVLDLCCAYIVRWLVINREFYTIHQEFQNEPTGLVTMDTEVQETSLYYPLSHHFEPYYHHVSNSSKSYSSLVLYLGYSNET